MKLIKKLFILLNFCIIFNTNATQISIDKFKITTDSKPNKEKVLIKNLTEKETYVLVEVYKLVKKDYKIVEEKIEDYSKENIIVSPTKLILQPKGNKKDQKNVDIITNGKNIEKEELYKVRFKPVVENESNNILIIISYETYVFIQPNNKVFDYKLEKNKNGTIIKNTGNTSFLITDMKKCNVLNKDCILPKNKTLLPESAILIKSEKDVNTTLSITNYKEEIIKIETK